MNAQLGDAGDAGFDGFPGRPETMVTTDHRATLVYLASLPL
jgi:hypothetical protein